MGEHTAEHAALRRRVVAELGGCTNAEFTQDGPVCGCGVAIAGHDVEVERIVLGATPTIASLLDRATAPPGDVVLPGQIAIPRPRVPYGPTHISEDAATAIYLDQVADNLTPQQGEPPFYRIAGSNVTAAVVGILRDCATVLRGPSTTPGLPHEDQP